MVIVEIVDEFVVGFDVGDVELVVFVLKVEVL